MRRFPIATTAAACVLLTGFAVPVAYAKTHHPVFPSKHKVHQAQEQVKNDKAAVARIRAKLAAATQREQDLQDKAEMASEAYDAAAWKAQQAQAAEVAAKKHAKLAADDQAAQRKAYAVAVVGNYQYAPQLTTLVAIAQSAGLDDIQQQTAAIGESQRALNAQYGRVQASSTLATVAEQQAADAAKAAEQAESEAKQKRDAAQSAADAAEAEAASVARERTHLIHQLALHEHISTTLAAKRQKGLERAAELRREAEARKKAAAAAAAAAGSHGGGGSAPSASSGGIAAAIAFARAQIGDPYVWAADGMSDWDCSGLTMMALRQAGIYLPHYSVWQYEESTPISYNDLRPGDLVFWSYYGTVSSIHHVALYVGNDMIIQAPHTGAYVEEVSMWTMGTPSFYARP